MDLVFGIETIVHCSDKDRLFREVNRILKPNGVFIVYDYASVKPYEENEDYECKLLDLVSKCGASARIESDLQWDVHFKNCGFEKISKTDLGQAIIPDLHRLALTAKKIMDHDRRLRIAFAVLPRTLTNNILIGYLGEDCYKNRLAYYNEWIYKKI